MTYHCFSKRRRIARKNHRCTWCHWPVLMGSVYRRERSIYDGEFQNFAWHEACWKDAQEWFDETGQEEYVSGNPMPFFALYQLETAAP